MGKKNLHEYIEEYFSQKPVPDDSLYSTESTEVSAESCRHQQRGGGQCDKPVFKFEYCREHLSDAFKSGTLVGYCFYPPGTPKETLALARGPYVVLPKGHNKKTCQFKLLKGPRQGKKCGSDTFRHGYCTKHLYKLFDE